MGVNITEISSNQKFLLSMIMNYRKNLVFLK